MSVSVALFTRDLRVHDNPMLHAAATAADRVVPLFVLDDAILRSDFNRPNRAQFLADSLRDLDESLRVRGAGLVVRRGDVVHETTRVADAAGAGEVHVSADASAYAQQRQNRLREGLGERALVVHQDTHFVVPPGAITPSGGDHMAVFTPYLRRWERHPTREPAPTPRRLSMPKLARGRLPVVDQICRGTASPDLAVGGETAGRALMGRWLRNGVTAYDEHHDALGEDGTSRLSPYLHFGCVSPLELVRKAGRQRSAGAAEFVRQVCWRDFHHQVLAARPASTRVDYRSRGDRWHVSDEELTAWREGRTGFPIVDAGMRQLAREGWMHNRARLITAHFLCKTLYLDWRAGAQHFVDLLLDADTANNTMNWQWVAGTGTDSRFNRAYNMVTQARRHDPQGSYIRRYVPELADVDDAHVHEPWLLPEQERGRLDYPPPIVDQAEARERIKQARSSSGPRPPW